MCTTIRAQNVLELLVSRKNKRKYNVLKHARINKRAHTATFLINANDVRVMSRSGQDTPDGSINLTNLWETLGLPSDRAATTTSTNTETVRSTMRRGFIPPTRDNIPGINRELDLWQAADIGDSQRVRELLRSGADPHLPIRVRRMPIQQAAYMGHVNVLREFKNHRVPFDDARYNDGEPLYVAVDQGHFKAVKFCLGVADALVDGWPENADRGTPLHRAIYVKNLNTHPDRNQDLVEIIRLLLEFGADINARKLVPFNNNVFRTACLFGDVETMDLLGEYGQLVIEPEGAGLSALHLAVQSDRPDAVQRLIDLGAEHHFVKGALGRPLHACLWKSSYNAAVLRVLLGDPRVDLFEEDSYGALPLYIAMENLNPPMVATLLNHSPEMEAQICMRNTRTNRTAFSLIADAFDHGFIEQIVEILVEYSEFINCVNEQIFTDRTNNDNKYTLLHWVVLERNTYLVKKLLLYGASIFVSDSIGNTPYDYMRYITSADMTATPEEAELNSKLIEYFQRYSPSK